MKGLDFLEWTKASIKTTSLGTEIITALLVDMGISGVEIQDNASMKEFFSIEKTNWDYIDEALLSPLLDSDNDTASVVFYLGTDIESQSLLSRINENLDSLALNGADLGELSLSLETVNDQDWLHEWKRFFHPIRIGRVLIVPEWDSSSYDNEIVFTIDPGSAFGTGQHATTMLCIEALQAHLQEGDTILDIGCGSGILSIISLLLGAKHVAACDIDPAATEITRKNAGLNPVNQSQLEILTGDIFTNPDLQDKLNRYQYDIVVANIVADVIICLAPIVKCMLKPGGTFVASGIICERLSDVTEAFCANNLKINDIKTSEGWCCVIANG